MHNLILEFMYEERIENAVRNFKEGGRNCCQAVVMAFADLFGFTEHQALMMSAALGHGHGVEKTCGALTGLQMLVGMKKGNFEKNNRPAHKAMYMLDKELMDRYAAQTGATDCHDLLALPPAGPDTPNPDAEGNYHLIPCWKKVEIASRLAAEYLEKEA